MWPRRHSPDLSVVVIVHNMAREAPRTLFSLSTTYQRHIAAEDYEVIVVDNGSKPPFDAKILERLTGNFRLVRLDPAPPSPARAINRGLAEARGKIIGIMIDGARIITPGLLHFARHGVGLYRRSVVVSLGWYLGRDLQRWSMEAGYNQQREDQMLASIGWPQDGYRLFEIGAFDESSVDGWFSQIEESNALFLRRESWDQLDGVDERFDAPAGGYLNLDTLARAIELPDSELVILLGEATFHQLHGGIATNQSYQTLASRLEEWAEQYQAIRQRPWRAPSPPNRTYIGSLPESVLPHLARSIVEPVRGLPLGPSFDRGVWLATRSPRPHDPICAALVDLAESEFRNRRFQASAAVARIARNSAPDEPAPQRLLAIAGAWLRDASEPPDDQRVGFHLARANAYRLLGDTPAADTDFRAALAWDADCCHAHDGLAELRLPGENYLSWLAKLHALLRPRTYLEIGVFEGRSLALAKPPTFAIGVDPDPKVDRSFEAHTQIFRETSDAFFSNARLTSLLNGSVFDLAFIDGLHLFEQALKDFINIEAHCGRHSAILIHDTIPLDEPTQRRTRSTSFFTGDVWKAALCLKHCRPDLVIITIATPPTGLTVVTGLDPSSRILAECYDEMIKRFMDMSYVDIENRISDELNIVPNDWGAVATQFKIRSIF
jgi:hypothetical protein